MLKAHAATLARQPYMAPPPPAPGVDDGRATTRSTRSSIKASATQLKAGDDGGVRFFPITHFQPTPVEIFLVDGDVAQAVPLQPDLFDMPADSPLAAARRQMAASPASG